MSEMRDAIANVIFNWSDDMRSEEFQKRATARKAMIDELEAIAKPSPASWDTLPEAERERLGRVACDEAARQGVLVPFKEEEQRWKRACIAIARAVWEASR